MSQVSERYAQALFDVTNKKNKIDEVTETLSALGDSISANEDVKKVLISPLVANAEKVVILKSAVGESLSDELSTFFDLLAKNNRLDSIPEIVISFKNAVAKASGIMSGEVDSATELTDQEKSEVQKNIESKLARKVELKYNVKPNMIGGIEAKVGSYIFEDSIESHMKKLNDYITRRVL